MSATATPKHRRDWEQRFRAAGGRLTSMRFTAAVRERLDTLAAENHCTRSDVVAALVMALPATVSQLTREGLQQIAVAAAMREHGMAEVEARDYVALCAESTTQEPNPCFSAI